jgi:ankyrin repeat protein
MKKIILLALMLMTTTAFAQTKATLKLFSAIEKNNRTLAQNALKEGADVNGVDNLRAPTTTVLLKAVHLNRLDIVKLLLLAHADVNIRRPIDMHTPLMVAARHDLAAIAELLINSGADVNLETLLQRTALHITALANSLSVAQVLVKAKDIDVNIRPNLCALAVAARQGNIGIVLLLKKQTGSKASSPVCLERAIQLAEYNKHEEILAILQRI